MRRGVDGDVKARVNVVQAVRDGMTQTDATRTYGVSLRAVSKWMKLARDGGLRALRPSKRGRRPGSGRLTHRQAVRIRKLIIEQMPDQLSLPFYRCRWRSKSALFRRRHVTVA
ncbi:helix-turn-helix domain-containing protein [Burkholderia ubonensis]|uniref:helix-turn-helix domain-containing protein n=1 Tax=Burkholderia ubonensis TaxID=101571 RepID=UPI0009B3B356|nr:helix-turn-helix domain-containing protein [Burkholderia ubonensis]